MCLIHFNKYFPTCKVRIVFSPSKIVFGDVVKIKLGIPEYWEKPCPPQHYIATIRPFTLHHVYKDFAPLSST